MSMEREEYIYNFYHKNSYNYPSQIKYAPGAIFKITPSLKYISHSYDYYPKKSYCLNNLNKVYSSRNFLNQPMTIHELLTILHSSYLIKKDKEGIFKSTTPSAGGIYPVELFLIINKVEGLKPGIFHYHREYGGLSYINSLPKSEIVVPTNKELVKGPVQVIFTINVENLVRKYGSRGYRYALIECGHIGQNFSQICASIGCGCCAIGGFYDKEITHHLNLKRNVLPVYMYALGRTKDE